MISISHVNKTYKKPPIHAVCDVSFSIKKGEVVGLLGPNGAGKTTLIKSISGLITFSEGNIIVDGFNINRQRRKALKQLGVVLDGTRNLYWRLTVRQNLEYFGMIRGMSHSQMKKKIPEVLELMEMEKFLNRQVGTLSSGQKHRVYIAAALIHNPSFLILDEPTNGLDVPSMDNLVSVLNNLRNEMNIGMLISSHNLSFVQRIVQRVIFINKGHVIGNLSIDEVKNFDLKRQSSTFDANLLMVYRELMSEEAK